MFQKMLNIIIPASKNILRKALKSETTKHFSNTCCIRTAEFDFKQQKKRKPRQQTSLKDPKTAAYLGVALLLTVAAPKVINDAIAFFDEEKDGNEVHEK